MKSLKDYIRENLENSNPICISISYDGCEITTYRSILVEGKVKGIPGTNVKYRYDQPNGTPRPGNNYHYHFQIKGKEIFAINIDGTGHDGTHQYKVPNKVADYMRDVLHLPLPEDNLIETIDIPTDDGRMLLLD